MAHGSTFSEHAPQGDGPAARRARQLSLRESAVLAVVRSGMTTKEIAARLRISHSTVNYHLANIYRKLRAHSRVEALNAFDELLALNVFEIERGAVDLGTRLAASIAAPAGAERRAAYYLLKDDRLTPFVEQDTSDARVDISFEVSEHPVFYDIVARGKALSGTLEINRIGPHVRKIATVTGVKAGAGVPVYRGNALHGILAVGSRGAEPPKELLGRLADLGRLVELALGQPRRNAGLLGT